MFCSVISFGQSVTSTITNFQITKDKLLFDVYILRTSKLPLNMGNSSYIWNVEKGVFKNPKIVYFNSKYTSKSNSQDYADPKLIAINTFTKSKIALQIYCTQGDGIGEEISGSGESIYGEKLCTIQMDIIKFGSLNIKWDVLNSATVTPSFWPIITDTYFIDFFKQ